MPVRIRLARHGKKSYAHYYIVVTDSRAPRDGKFVEKLGIYNPNTNPATIELDFERALYWVQTGAQPSDTAKTLLSKQGVMLKKHLIEGVKKGALTTEQVEEKFQAWVKEKEEKIRKAKAELEEKTKKEIKKRLDAESKKKEERAAAIAKKQAEASKKEETEQVQEETTSTEQPANE